MTRRAGDEAGEPVHDDAETAGPGEEPAQAVAEPTGEVTEPVANDTGPVESDAEPVANDTGPVESDAEPVEGGAESADGESEFAGDEGPSYDGLPVAEPAQRVVARIVDTLVVGVPIGMAAAELFPRETAQIVVAPIAFATVFLVYETVQLALWGRTLGKRFAGIRVVSAAGGRPAALQCLVRAAVYALPPAARPVPVLNVLAGIFWLADIGFVFDAPYRQTVHDRAAGTLVVADGPGRTPAPRIGPRPEHAADRSGEPEV